VQPQNASGGHNLLAGPADAPWEGRRIRFKVLKSRKLPHPQTNIHHRNSEAQSKTGKPRRLRDVFLTLIEGIYFEARCVDEFSKWRAMLTLRHPAGLGDKDQAFYWLEKAFEERDSAWFPMIKVSPLSDPLRSDPRFQALLRRMNFPS
jgi:hypothetical protein